MGSKNYLWGVKNEVGDENMENDYEHEDRRKWTYRSMEASYSNLNVGKRKSAKSSYCATRKLLALFQMAENLNLKISWWNFYIKVAEMLKKCQNLN